MAEELTITSLDHLTSQLQLGRTTELSSLGFNRQSTEGTDLAQGIRVLIQSVEATATKAHQVESTHTQSGWDIAQLSSLRRSAKALLSTTEIFSNAAERYIVAYVTSLARPGTLVRKILSQFGGELRRITRDVLNNTSNDSSVLRETLEMCYGQSLDTSGVLHSDNYFIPLDEASLQGPYDPDYESEEYYEHENRLDVDNIYAEAYLKRCKRQFEERRQSKEEWIRFWVQALNECPDGPTLFYPPANRRLQCHLADVPRYLFRTFDHESSGRSDQNVVASMESISGASSNSKGDLLLRTEKEAAKMLYEHLNIKSLFGGMTTDNLMSWSSSLLFVIQYAIWRCCKRCRDPATVWICTVDTRKFPRGQFARDMSLLQAYHGSPALDEDMRGFFDFRLKNKDYDNGEYLSQGVLYHTGRSNMVSLDQLIQAGLYDLYPALSNSAAMKSWTNRVKTLRSIWAAEHTTTQLDLERAFKIARACFQFNAPDIALLLLSFKNRKLRASMTQGKFQFSNSLRQQWLNEAAKVKEELRKPNYGPVEVQRYMKIIETSKERDYRDGTIEMTVELVKDMFVRGDLHVKGTC